MNKDQKQKKKQKKLTDIAFNDLGSNKSFSPGGRTWCSRCSSCNCCSFSRPSTTVIQFPPRYLGEMRKVFTEEINVINVTTILQKVVLHLSVL